MNLFIIGSGFTKALFPDAPLNRELLETLARGAPDSASHKLINRYQTEDIESALTKLDVDLASHQPHLEQAGDELRELRHHIEKDLGSHFTSYRASNGLLSSSLWLSNFLDHAISEGDVAVSLNYDCVFEGVLDCRAKWSPNGGYGFLRHPLVSDGRAALSPVTVLKIHGSASFRIAPCLNKPNSRAVSFVFDEWFFPRSAENTHFGYGLGRGESYLIAPSYVKVPAVEITYLMLDALKASARAKNLIIIGCGLRPEDAFLTLLLTEFLRQPDWRNRRIAILDPSAEAVSSRLKVYWGVDVSSCIVPIEGRLEDSVDQLLETILK